MKIAIIMPLAEQRGGGELMLWHLMQQGRDLEVEWVVIFLEKGPMVPQIEELEIENYVLEAGRLRQIPLFLASVVRIAARLKRVKADAVFSWMSKPHLYGSLAALLAGLPAFWYQLGMPSRSSRLDRAATWLPAAGILTCSNAGATAQSSLKPVRPVQVVYPGVELERFTSRYVTSPDEARRQLGLPLDGPLIGIVGRLQRWKGIHVLVESMPRILERYPNAHCVIVGGQHDLEPEYGPYVEQQIESLGLKHSVILSGLQKNIPEWMQAMDIFVHASDNEPFGIVIIEAMALGKPVIAGNRGGPTEIITDGVDGLLTPYGDSEALAKAVLCYLDNREFAQKLGQQARKRAQEFSTRQYAINFVEAVERLAPARLSRTP